MTLQELEELEELEELLRANNELSDPAQTHCMGGNGGCLSLDAHDRARVLQTFC